MSETDFIFLWPGGIREVKDPLLALRAFRRVERHHPQARLLFVGPLLEPAYGRRFRRALRGRAAVRYCAAVRPAQMPGVYAAADAVVNSSRAEGMSNALLEAMAAGVPVLARGIAGNRALVRHNKTGLLFSSETDCARQAERLLTNSKLRRQLSSEARAFVRRAHSEEAEVRAYQGLYRRTLAAGLRPADPSTLLRAGRQECLSYQPGEIER